MLSNFDLYFSQDLFGFAQIQIIQQYLQKVKFE